MTVAFGLFPVTPQYTESNYAFSVRFRLKSFFTGSPGTGYIGCRLLARAGRSLLAYLSEDQMPPCHLSVALLLLTTAYLA